MILVDSRAGSRELVVPLARAGVPVEETVLDFGDLAFMGRGERGAPVFIGIEYKKLPDLVQSLTTDRLAGHQLTGMHGTEDAPGYDRSYLLIEGLWDVDKAGRVIVPSKRFRNRWEPLKGGMPAFVMQLRVFTLETRGGLRVGWTKDQTATVRYLTAVYRFWTDKNLDEHKSHLAIHAPDLDRSLLVPVSDFRRIVAMIPGIGYKTSAAVEAAFNGSIRRMMLATEAEWAAITTTDDKGKPRRIGAARARKIMEVLA